MSSKKVKLPSVERLVWKTILMIFLMFFASTIFISLDDYTYSPLVPIVFLSMAIPPIMAKFKYGYKKEPIYKRDMRYKTGARVIGYKHVIDRSNKILFNEKQIKISKIEGYIKIGFIIIAVGLIIYHINTADFKMKHMGPSKMISKLNDGDTLFSNKSYLLFYTKFKNKSINGFDFDKRGLDTINCFCFFISADSIQINKDNRSKEEKDTSHYKFEKFKPVYDYYFQVKPFENLITIEPEIYKSSDIINKNWYVKSSDVNIGIYKYNIENQSFNPESIKN